jgi:hypothetical protein
MLISGERGADLDQFPAEKNSGPGADRLKNGQFYTNKEFDLSMVQSDFRMTFSEGHHRRRSGGRIIPVHGADAVDRQHRGFVKVGPG